MEHSEVAARAVRPTATDLLEARECIMRNLDKAESASFVQIRTDMLRAHGLTWKNDGRVDFEGTHGHLLGLNEADPLLQQQRIDYALREVFAQLVAEGAVLPVEAHGSAPAVGSVYVQNSSGTTSFDYEHHYAQFSQTGRWKSATAPAHRSALANVNLPDELPELLGPRGVQVLAEAIRCFHKGLFVAATDLLAAASEAAWFKLGGYIADDAQLADLVKSGTNAAKVIERTADSIQRTRAWNAQQLNDLRARAAHLRDLRNYGLHPVGIPDDDREPAFGEAGCAVLFMAAPRYFRLLEQVRQVLAARAEPDAPTD